MKSSKGVTDQVRSAEAQGAWAASSVSIDGIAR
jgi:hypothetical protein